MDTNPEIYSECQKITNVTNNEYTNEALNLICYNFFIRLSNDVLSSDQETLGIKSVTNALDSLNLFEISKKSKKFYDEKAKELKLNKIQALKREGFGNRNNNVDFMKVLLEAPHETYNPDE